MVQIESWETVECIDCPIMCNESSVYHSKIMRSSQQTPGVGVTKAPFVNFSVSKIFGLAKKYQLDSLKHIHI